MTVVLIPGGLYEDMDAARFWETPGVVDGLESAGFDVLTVERPARPRSWRDESDSVAVAVAGSIAAAVPVVAGSNGCSAAVRLAIDHPHLVARLVLSWPATAGDPEADAVTRRAIESVVDPATADRLLAGGILRGVTDAELAGLRLPVAVIPCEPENPFHRRSTVDALAAIVPGVEITDGFPESPQPGFAPRLDAFLAVLTARL